MAINLRQLEAFRAVIVTGSITGAASYLHVSQPAVSRLVADLEQSIGFPLFERRNRRLHVKPEGEIFYREVEKSFVGIAKIVQKAQEIRDFKTGHLRIAGMPAVSLSLLPSVIRTFKESFPDVVVSLQIRSSPHVVELLTAPQFDLGLAALPLGESDTAFEPLDPPPCVCVLPAGHRLLRHSMIRAEMLAGEPFISLGGDSMLRFRIDRLFQEAGVRRNLVLETPMSASVLLLVGEGLGVAVIDPFTAASFPVKGVESRPFLPAVPYEFGLLFPQTPRSRITDAFVTMLKTRLALFRSGLTEPAEAPDGQPQAAGRRKRPVAVR